MDKHKCAFEEHYRVIGDGIAVLKPETLKNCPKFLEALERMRKIRIGGESDHG